MPNGTILAAALAPAFLGVRAAWGAEERREVPLDVCRREPVNEPSALRRALQLGRLERLERLESAPLDRARSSLEGARAAAAGRHMLRRASAVFFLVIGNGVAKKCAPFCIRPDAAAGPAAERPGPVCRVKIERGTKVVS
jgi:hypothetical protein